MTRGRVRFRQAGFTLVEVLVAAMVCATLSIGLLSLQRNNIRLAEGIGSQWETINFAQTLLAERDFEKLKNPTPVPMPWPDKEGATWELNRRTFVWTGVRRTFDDEAESQFLSGIGDYTLVTRYGGARIEWRWLGME